MSIDTLNPATGQLIRSYTEMTGEEVERRIQAAATAFGIWRRESFEKKSVMMKNAAARLRSNQDSYARLMAFEMGKPLTQGLAEIEKSARVCEYYAEQAEAFLKPEEISTDASKSYAAFEPLGVLLAVMPWNFPFWQVFRAAVPALMAGNTVLLKHASNVPDCAEAIEAIFKVAGFPEGVFTNLFVRTERTEYLVGHPLVKAVTLTGSVGAGRAVAAKAGAGLKKSVLELGGSDAYIILDDADLEEAVKICAASRLINSGQSCVSAKRFIVEAGVHDAFLKGLVSEMRHQKMGDPLEDGTTVGPLARKDLRDGVHRQVTDSVAQGAKLILGGHIPPLDGFFYAPTILSEVIPGMTAFDEEIFGPVAAVTRARDEADAIRLANDSVFGLGAAIFTKDVKKGERIAHEELKAGCAFVNAAVKSDLRLPFGGVDQSGYGRELGIYGIREFVNIKAVYVR
jgi:succinate-semialdehyde dehydrogenase/glutarate-semialdehyde dehydrogenase